MFGECHCTSPSVFGPQLLADSSNVCQRRILLGGVQQGVAQDYWNERNAAAYNQGSTDGSTYDTQTNIRSLKTIFTSCLNLDMTDTDNIAKFLLEFLIATRCFKISINSLSGDSFEKTSICWAPITVNNLPSVTSNVGFIDEPHIGSWDE